MDEFVRQALQARNDPRKVVADPDALYFGDYKVDDSTLVPADGAMVGDGPVPGLARAPARGGLTLTVPVHVIVASAEEAADGNAGSGSAARCWP